MGRLPTSPPPSRETDKTKKRGGRGLRAAFDYSLDFIFRVRKKDETASAAKHFINHSIKTAKRGHNIEICAFVTYEKHIVTFIFIRKSVFVRVGLFLICR